MEVSDCEDPGGEELLQSVIALTGLPKELISQELKDIVAKAGYESTNLTLDQLRHVMLSYLESMSETFNETETALPSNTCLVTKLACKE